MKVFKLNYTVCILWEILIYILIKLNIVNNWMCKYLNHTWVSLNCCKAKQSPRFQTMLHILNLHSGNKTYQQSAIIVTYKLALWKIKIFKFEMFLLITSTPDVKKSHIMPSGWSIGSESDWDSSSNHSSVHLEVFQNVINCEQVINVQLLCTSDSF